MIGAALLGVLVMSGGQLKLETATKVTKTETTVQALMKNVGGDPMKVLTDSYFVLTHVRLFEGEGKELVARDGRATQGARKPPDAVKLTEVAAGKSLEVVAFTLVHASGMAMAGDLSWELAPRAGQAITIELVYAVDEATAARAKELKAEGFEVGEWKSKRVIIRVPKK